MNNKIQEIKEALAGITQGEWWSTDDAVRITPADSEVCVWICQMYEEDENGPDGIAPFPNYENNAKFIANAPSYISYLLQQIEIKDKALDFYADKENYRGYYSAGKEWKSPVNDDWGDLARATLKGEDTQS
ncbi:hypothetical protein [Paenibacillus sp. NRS-1781]|uniref:hypothetical protein n=1 Tax=Paenibacillus sp. NRS-1781 TaxID=3233905 RepID=UPI003D27F4B9